MNNRRSSIDGFIPRRANSQVGERRVVNGTTMKAPNRKELKNGNDLLSTPIGTARPGRAIGGQPQAARPASRAKTSKKPTRSAPSRSDIDESLRQLDGEQPPKKMSRREKKRWKKEHRSHKQMVRRRTIIIVVSILAIILLSIIGFLAYKALKASGNVLQGNFLDLIQQEPLKKDANGRSNFLILGTSEDDPGHEAGNLTDSIMILSIDQEKKDAYTFSIPRDLYVEYGMACTSGYRGKINAYFSCVNDGTDDAAEEDRQAKTREFIGKIIGVDIQYSVHVNYTVMRDVVNAIGGSITVTIDSRDPRGVMDSNFDWKCGKLANRVKNCPPDGHYIQYPNGEVTLDAEHALYLAQARGDAAPTYGFEQSNFDRERNQQKILVAIRDKALSSGTLTNLGAVTKLIDALGSNLRTNIQTKEIRTLMDVAQHIDNANIHSIDFYSDDNKIFTTGTLAGAGSSVYPSAGLYDYSELQALIQKELTSNPVVKEAPHITVLNGSNEAGVAQKLADSLEAKGFTVDAVDNAPDGSYGSIEIYQIDSSKTASAAKLKELYGVTLKTTAPPVSVTGETDFLIIIGNSSVLDSVKDS